MSLVSLSSRPWSQQNAEQGHRAGIHHEYGHFVTSAAVQNLSVENVHTKLSYRALCQQCCSRLQRLPDATMPGATASPLHGTSGDDLAAPLLEPPSEPTQTKRAAGVRRILRQSRPEWPAMAAATLCLVLAVLGQAVMPLLFGRMVDATSDTSGSRDARLRRYSAACAELAVVVGVSLFFTAVRAYVFNSAGAKVVARLRVLLFGRMLAQETAWFDARETGDLLCGNQPVCRVHAIEQASRRWRGGHDLCTASRPPS